LIIDLGINLGKLRKLYSLFLEGRHNKIDQMAKVNFLNTFSESSSPREGREGKIFP
jgi:hypothetical protein